MRLAFYQTWRDTPVWLRRRNRRLACSLVEEMAQVQVRVVEIASPVVNEFEVGPFDPSQPVRAGFYDVGAGGGSQNW
jgi:hypothetical protein